MTKLEYAEEVAKKVSGGVGAKEVVKNGVKMTAVEIKIAEDEHITACHYIDKMYDEDVDIDEAVSIIEKAVENSADDREAVVKMAEGFRNYDEVKDKLALRLYNKNSAEGYPIHRSAEEYGFDDLIIVPMIKEDGRSAVVTEQLLKEWGITEDELFEKSIENAKNDVEIRSMFEVLHELMLGKGMEDDMMLGEEPDENGMYVISNRNKVFGATAVLFAGDRLNEMFPNGYVILPSSIHEVIAVALPDEIAQFDALVQEVNDTQVAPEEVLGNKAYVFRVEEK